MRRTAILRLLIIDQSELAKNMYELLFADLPGFRIEFATKDDDLSERQRRGRPHIILLNSNSVDRSEAPDFIGEYPTVLLLSPDRQDLKTLARENERITLVEKPFYPYDLITIINQVAQEYHPLSGSVKPPPPPKRRRIRTASQRAKRS